MNKETQGHIGSWAIRIFGLVFFGFIAWYSTFRAGEPYWGLLLAAMAGYSLGRRWKLADVGP